MTRILALGHQSRVGKDTAARAMERWLLSRGLNVARLSWAGPLKRIAHELLGHAGLREAAFYETPEGEPLRDVPLCGGCPPPPAPGKQAPPCPGLVHLTPVQCWIHLGQKMRDIYPAVWVDAGIRRVQEFWGLDVAIITDLRFQNEAEAVRAAGGWCVRVARKDAPPPKCSDDRINRDFKWDAVLENDAGLDLLEARAIDIAGRALAAWPELAERWGAPETEQERQVREYDRFYEAVDRNERPPVRCDHGFVCSRELDQLEGRWWVFERAPPECRLCEERLISQWRPGGYSDPVSAVGSPT